jgi:hypothetical protein
MQALNDGKERKSGLRVHFDKATPGKCKTKLLYESGPKTEDPTGMKQLSALVHVMLLVHYIGWGHIECTRNIRCTNVLEQIVGVAAYLFGPRGR